jgi:high-affinity iron transporter
MLAGFLLSLREGLEAALVIGIALGVLFKLKRTDLNVTVWYGAGAAAVLSVIAALALNWLGMEFEGRAEQVFEGLTMLLAAGVLTWMILWMQHSAGNLKSEIEGKTNASLRGNGQRGLFTLAFLAVFREGIELALFLMAAEKTSSPVETLFGALAGLAGAAVLGWMLFSSTRRLSPRGIFRVTNILLIFFAAGLVAVGVHEFNEAGLIPALVAPIWNFNGVLSDESQFGLLLKGLLGYNGAPSLTEALAYVVYLGGIGLYVLTRKPKAITAAASTGPL